MLADQSTIIVGTFDDRQQARAAIAALEDAGFGESEIGFVVRGERLEGAAGAYGYSDDPMQLGPETGTRAEERAVTGAAAGAGVGGIIGAAAALLVPGIGPVLAGGVLATVLGGAAIGAAGGGILGAMTGSGIPEARARYYEDQFRAGRAIVTVRADERARAAADILARSGADDIERCFA
jgi:hypothetical protein